MVITTINAEPQSTQSILIAVFIAIPSAELKLGTTHDLYLGP